MSTSEQIHATAVIWKGAGILLLGEAGSGKSGLAAEVIVRGGELVGDDQLLICEEKGKLFVDAPPQLAGVLELRDMGLVKLPYVASTQIHLVIRCGTGPAQREQYEKFGVTLPCIALDSTHAGNAARVMLYAEALQEGRVLPRDWRP